MIYKPDQLIENDINLITNSAYDIELRLSFDAKEMACDGLPSQAPIPAILSETVGRHFEVVRHYDSLIDENNDPVHDPEPLREYMNKWDGQAFINELQLSKDKRVLEIGIGTGRLAVKVAPECGSFTGIDISPKTIDRAKDNLSDLSNVTLVCDDFMTHRFDDQFDAIYSSLTFMHISDKLAAIDKISRLLAPSGYFVLSIDKNPCDCIDMGNRIIKIFPDNPEDICGYIKAVGMRLERQFETEFAFIFAASK